MRSFPGFWVPILYLGRSTPKYPMGQYPPERDPWVPALALIADTKVSVLALPDANFDVPPPKLGMVHNQIKNSKYGKVQESNSRFLSVILWTLVKTYCNNNAVFRWWSTCFLRALNVISSCRVCKTQPAAYHHSNKKTKSPEIRTVRVVGPIQNHGRKVL